MLYMVETGHPALVDMPMDLTRTQVAALCRRWLEVEDAEVVCFWSGDYYGEFTTDSPEQADAIQTGQRVRLVREYNYD